MEYTHSNHYREDLAEEVDAALSANSIESVKATFKSRTTVEIWQKRPDIDAIERIQQQLAHIATVAAEAESLVQDTEISAAA